MANFAEYGTNWLRLAHTVDSLPWTLGLCTLRFKLGQAGGEPMRVFLIVCALVAGCGPSATQIDEAQRYVIARTTSDTDSALDRSTGLLSGVTVTVGQIEFGDQWSWTETRAMVDSNIVSGYHSTIVIEETYSVDPSLLEVPIVTTEDHDVLMRCRVDPCFSVSSSEFRENGYLADGLTSTQSPAESEMRHENYWPYDDAETAQGVAEQLTLLARARGAKAPL